MTDPSLWPEDVDASLCDEAVRLAGTRLDEVLPPSRVEPNPGPQAAALASPADMLFYGGQAGGGKTVALLLDAARDVDVEGYAAAIFRRTSPLITHPGGLWPASWELYPALEGKPRHSPHLEWRFPSGAVVRFAHCQHEADRLQWKGAQIAMLGFDQVEEFTRAIFWYLWSRNRSTCGVRPRVRATCNPVPPDDPIGGWLHELIGWWIGEDGLPIEERAGALRWFLRVRDELVWFDSPEAALEFRDVEGMPDTVGPTSVTFIPARLEDNPVLMEKAPSYAAKLEALSSVERARLRGGNWLVRETAGTVFDRAWFPLVDALPGHGFTAVRFWDKAGTAGGRGAETAGVKVLADHLHGWYYVADVVHGRWGDMEREAVIRQTAEADGRGVKIRVEQEPGSGGKDSARATVRMLAGYDVRARPAAGQGSKVERARPLAAQSEAGNVRVLRAPWAETFLAQAHSFPLGLIDVIDAAVGAFNELALKESGAAVAAARLTGFATLNEGLRQPTKEWVG